MTGTVTFKHCGICGNLVKENDSTMLVPTTVSWGSLTLCQMYHLKCYEKEKGE